jgi:excisionase family DNA binding protein
MPELLTTKQLQDLLQIDRMTVYRMLADGRLNGVKVGNQWRFSQSEVARILGEKTDEDEAVESITDFPEGCVKEIQDIFAGILGVGAITVTLKGTPLTQPTYSNPFCKLILASPKGRQACQQSWCRIASKSARQPDFHVCHAGLCYMRSPIEVEGKKVSWLIAGQYYLNPPDPQREQGHITQLASEFGIPEPDLQVAAKEIPVLKRRQLEQVREWTPKVAGTVQSILCERSDLLSRFQRIAELSSIHPALSK